MKALVLILHVNILFLHSYYALKCSGNGDCILCDNQSDNCIECIPGLFGPQCDRKCRPNCIGNSCILEAGIDVCKDGCKPGYYGRRCSVPCRRTYLGCVKCVSGCQDGFCLDNQSCFYGCFDSYYGSNCLNCSHSCKVCNHVSGLCKECISKFGGPNCSVSCENCLGSCTKEGCHNGCTTGYYGTYCNDVCSSNCLDGCQQGNCNDCQDGRYGAICQHRCSKGCTNNTCTLNGRCLHGCKDGYFGPDCASTCEDACIKNKCKGESRQFCLKVCNTCGQSCRDKPINCSESCLITLLSKACKDTTTPTTSQIAVPTSIEATQDGDDSLVIYLAVSVTGLLVIIVCLFIYFSCRFQRIRTFMYGSVRMPTIPMTPPADQSVPSDAHEYNEVEDTPSTIDLTNPIIAEVFSSGFASASRSLSFPRLANYSTTTDVRAEGEYLTPRADPLQRPACRNTL